MLINRERRTECYAVGRRALRNGEWPRGRMLSILNQGTHMCKQAAKMMAKIGFLVLKNMFKGQQMKIESLLAAIAH